MEIIRNLQNSLTTPGSSLHGRDKIAFDNFKSVIDRCTHELLIRPDWPANMECVDLANGERSRPVFAEVVVYLRKKLGSKTPKVVLMTMTLAETLVKNGTALVHGSIGNDLFMEEMARVARKYNGKLGADNREVADLALDIIQAWGEGFAVRQQQFPAFTKYYHQLRREGLPFNPQFDASKVPDFAPPAASGASAQEAEDELMAQALAASMSGLSEGEDYGRRDSSPDRYRDTPPPQRQPVQRMTYSELIATVDSNIGLTRDVITASSPAELRSNDVVTELIEQLSAYLELLVRAIDQAVVEQPESVEALFKAHADATDTLQLYRDVMGGAPSASSTERPIVHGRVVSQQQSKPAAPVHNVAPLLDLSDDVSNPLLMAQTITPVTRTQPVAVSMARTATPSRERPQAAAPSAAVPTPDLLGDPFAPVAKPVPAATPTSSTTTHDPFATSADPFGGGSSIDSLLAQPPASNKPAQTDVMALFNTPPSTSPNATRK